MAGTGARAIVLSNPANPTGRIHPGREIDAIAGIARESGALLLIDESFSGVLFAQDKWRESVCSAYERLVVVNSFSKSHHLQGLRVGLCAAQGQLVRRYRVGAPDGGERGIESLAGRGPGPARRRWRDAGLQPGTGDDDRVRARSRLGMPSGGRELLCLSRIDGIDAFESAGGTRNVLMLRGDAFGPAYADHVRLCFGKPAAELERIFALLRGS